MLRSKHNRFKLILIATLAVTACTATGPVAHPSATVKAPLPTSEQNNEQLNQMQTQIQIMQAQIDELQNQLNKIQQQQTTLSRYLNVHIPAATHTIPTASNKTTNIAEARRLYNAGLYTQSIRLLKNADSGGNGSPMAQERMLLLVQNHAHLNNCESVIIIGKRFNSLYPHSSQNPNIMYMIAQCQNQMQQQDIARVTCKHIINMYPNSSAAAKAKQLLTKMK